VKVAILALFGYKPSKVISLFLFYVVFDLFIMANKCYKITSLMTTNTMTENFQKSFEE